jgi:hypothetical protein
MRGQIMQQMMERHSVFYLEPAEVHWLAQTFEHESPQHALLDRLASAAEEETAPPGVTRTGMGQNSRLLIDVLPATKVGEIVQEVGVNFPSLPIPQRPGRAQLGAIDELIRE